MANGDIRWILSAFESYRTKIPERRLLAQCKTKEKLAQLLNEGYIILISEDDYGRYYSLTQKARDLLNSPTNNCSH